MVRQPVYMRLAIATTLIGVIVGSQVMPRSQMVHAAGKWASAEFSAHGISPHWGQAIAASWLKKFHNGKDFGPALDPVKRNTATHIRSQHFARGLATYSAGRVRWTWVPKSMRHHYWFKHRAWERIQRFGDRFGQLYQDQNGTALRHLLTPPLASLVKTYCAKYILRLPDWSSGFRANIREWGNHSARLVENFTVNGGDFRDLFSLTHGTNWKVAAINVITPRARHGWRTCQAWTPPPNAFPNTYAVGDSVMLDGSSYLSEMGITVDAVVGRQFDTGKAILKQKLQDGSLPARVIVGLGTNGPMTQADFDSMMHMLRKETSVVVVTVREPRSWQDQVNAVIRRGVKKSRNGEVADWYAASNAHADYFAADGIHLSAKGALVYAHVIANAMAN